MSDKPDEKYLFDLSMDDDKLNLPTLPSSELPKKRAKRTDPTRSERVQTRSHKSGESPAKTTNYTSEINSDSEKSSYSDCENSESEMSMKKPFDIPIFDSLQGLAWFNEKPSNYSRYVE